MNSLHSPHQLILSSGSLPSHSTLTVFILTLFILGVKGMKVNYLRSTQVLSYNLFSRPLGSWTIYSTATLTIYPLQNTIGQAHSSF